MKRLICILIITALLFSTAALVGCNVSGKPAEDSFEAMDTFMSFKAYGENSDSVVSQIREKILRLDSLFSTTNSDSDIYRINKRTSDSVKVDDVTADAVSKSLEICKSVDGVLDISVYPIVREWGFIDKDYKIPDKSRIDELLKCVDYTKVSVSDGQITLLPDMELDLGAVAKGYAADEAIEICKSNNTSSALLNLGGTIAAVGKKPDGSSWKIGVANPKNSADYFGYLSCSDCVAATWADMKDILSAMTARHIFILSIQKQVIRLIMKSVRLRLFPKTELKATLCQLLCLLWGLTKRRNIGETAEILIL